MFIILQIPKQYQNLNRQSKEKYDEHHAKLIEELIACDDFEDIATLKVIKRKKFYLLYKQYHNVYKMYFMKIN